MDDPVLLDVGMNTTGVVRIGDTVRRPQGPWSKTVHALLGHLERVGFQRAPRVLGVDEEGREILSYAPGHTAGRTELAADALLHAAAGLVAQFHRAAASFVLPPDAVFRDHGGGDPAGGPLVLHGDLGGWNVVVHDDGLTIIDWDDIHLGRPEWEIGYCLLSFADLWPDTELCDAEAARRIAVFADGYQLTRPRLRLALNLAPERFLGTAEAIVHLAAAGGLPGIRMRDAGTHLHWMAVAEYWRAQVPGWLRSLA